MHSFHIYRHDPDRNDAPRMQVLELEVDPGDRMLLDVLIRLKAVDPSLSFRRCCRESICGSDAMNINGRNGPAILNCVDVCPKNLLPAAAIGKIKEMMVRRLV